MSQTGSKQITFSFLSYDVMIILGVGDDQCGGHEGEADNDEDQPRPDPHHPSRPPEEWYTQIFIVKTSVAFRAYPDPAF